jgi:hypothetical protein
MLLNPYLYGEKKDGYVMKIPVAGFNGIAGILWAEDFLMMNDKSNDGVQYVDTSHKLGRTASKET